MTIDQSQKVKGQGQRSRSQGHVTYQQQYRYNEATDGRINFKVGGNCHREVRIT